jgi:hypothetical protein
MIDTPYVHEQMYPERREIDVFQMQEEIEAFNLGLRQFIEEHQYNDDATRDELIKIVINMCFDCKWSWEFTSRMLKMYWDREQWKLNQHDLK